MTTELDRLAAARPTQYDATEPVTEAERRAMFERITQVSAEPERPSKRPTPRPSRLFRWRWPATAAVAGLAAVLIVVGLIAPSGTPGGPNQAAAAALEHVADVAAGSSGPIPGPDQFQFTETLSARYGLDASSGRSQEWRSPDGRSWKSVVAAAGHVTGQLPVGCYFRPAPSGSASEDPRFPSFGTAPQALLSGLPTDPHALREYLRTHVAGGLPEDQLVFKALQSLLFNPLSPPALRAAAIRVLALDPRHIAVNEHGEDSQGRPAIVATIAFEVIVSESPGLTRPPAYRQIFYFDPATSQLLEAELEDGGTVTFRDVRIASEVVDAVPADVLACLAAK